MSFLKKIFGGRTIGEVSNGKPSPVEESPIKKMKRHLKEGYGMVDFDKVSETLPDGFGDPDYMSEEDQQKAIKALIPRSVSAFREVARSGASIFPTSVDAVNKSVPTMDSVNGPGVHNIPVNGSSTKPGVGLPGAVGKASKPISGVYPPKNGRNAAVDSNGMSMMPDPLMRFPINPRVLKHFQSRIWITYSGCAIISTHELVNRACAIPAEDAIAHGYKVVCSSHRHDHDDKHDANEARFLYDVKIEADKMGLNQACVQLNYKKKVFGVGIAIPRVKFRKDAKSPRDKSGNTPYSYADEYDPKMIEPGSFKGFAVVDPHWLTYEFDEESANDPVSPYFFVPTWVHTRSQKYHRSWMIRVINSEIPDLLKPTYYFGGLSLTQMIYERVWCADKLANEAPLLAMTKRLLIADGNLEQLISDPRHTNIFFKAINYFRDNFSIFVKKPSSNVTQLDTSLADLTPLTMSQYQLVSAIAQIPVTKLMKNVPSGLQATGQYEWDDYAQSLKAIQMNDYTPLCRMFYELYVASNYPNRTDISLDIEWNPIDIPKEAEVTQMSSQSAQFVCTLLGNGAVTVAEARTMLRHTNLPAFQALAPEVPKLLKKFEEAKDPEKQAQIQQQHQMAGLMGGVAGAQGGMPGAEGQPGTANGQQQQTVDPTIVENDRVFKNALKSVIGEGEENGDQSSEQPQEGEQKASEGDSNESQEGSPKQEPQQGNNEEAEK